MALGFDVNVTLQGKIFDAKIVRQATAATIRPAMSEAVLLLERETKSGFPIGATGLGRNSIEGTTRMVLGQPIEVIGRVTSALPYVRFVELGTRPHWPPIRPLKLWAKRVLGDEGAAWAIQRKIARRGTRRQEVFAKALRRNRGRINMILQAAGRRWEALLNG